MNTSASLPGVSATLLALALIIAPSCSKDNTPIGPENPSEGRPVEHPDTTGSQEREPDVIKIHFSAPSRIRPEFTGAKAKVVEETTSADSLTVELITLDTEGFTLQSLENVTRIDLSGY